MLRFGLHLTLRTGREALTRLLVTAAAVGLGVTLLLSVFALYHGYQATISRPCWECTHQQAEPASAASLLWNYREDYYQGRPIERLDVASIAATTPILPGTTRMPAAGQFYASPAMAALLKVAPADELGARFPGTLAGTIGTAGLTGPDELVIVIGHAPADLASSGHTRRVSQINTAPRQYSTSQFYKFGIAMGAVALLIPMLVLIGTATRLAAARREERYAALRLIGATRPQISLIASIDAILGALVGAVLGLAGYAALRPLLTGVKLIGTRFYAADVTPAGWVYPAVLIGVPVVAAVTSVVSLYRIGVSPLGVSRRVTPPPPRAWRLILLGIGLPLFCVPLLLNEQKVRHNPGPAAASLVLVILGLMVAGPWLTMRAASLLARYARSGPAVLAARRLADNPRAAYRSVSGLVLAVMVGTALAAIIPAAVGAQQTAVDSQLDNVLRAGFVSSPDCIHACGQPTASASLGMPPASAAALITELDAIPGAYAIPMYFDHGAALITCADLRYVAALGTCPPGAQSTVTDMTVLFTDNIAALNRRLPLITTHTPTTSDSTAGLSLSVVLVSVDRPTTLERARTVLSRYAQASDDANQAPQTFAEVAQARTALYVETQRAVIIVAGLTLLIAGCSLAVAFSGSIIERKRPFTLLRLTGTPVRALYRVVLLETVVPLIAATVLAAIVGFTVAVPVARALAPASNALPLPDATYYFTLGSGLLLAIALILTCLPILSRTTVTDNIRFE